MWIENGIMWVKAAEGTAMWRETTPYLQHYHKIITAIWTIMHFIKRNVQNMCLGFNVYTIALDTIIVNVCDFINTKRPEHNGRLFISRTNRSWDMGIKHIQNFENKSQRFNVSTTIPPNI